MHIDVAFTPVETAPAPLGVVVDVIRATSTIAQALAAGYERVLCCAEIEEARALRAELPSSLVGGERKAVRIEGFDVGASPREFLEARAETLIFATTSCSEACSTSTQSPRQWTGAIRSSPARDFRARSRSTTPIAPGVSSSS